MRFSLLAVAVLLSAGAVAKADTFSFSFGTSADTFSGSGFLNADLTSTPGEYLINGIIGTAETAVNGVNRNISALLPPGSFPTTTNGGSDLSNDNLLFVTDGVGILDGNGLSFALANGAQINLYNEDSPFGDALLERTNGNVVGEEVPVTITAVTPEPSSLVLLGTGLLGAVGMMRRRIA